MAPSIHGRAAEQAPLVFPNGKTSKVHLENAAVCRKDDQWRLHNSLPNDVVLTREGVILQSPFPVLHRLPDTFTLDVPIDV